MYRNIAKAIHGTALAVVGALATATLSDSVISLNEGLVAAGTGLAAFGAIYFSTGPTVNKHAA